MARNGLQLSLSLGSGRDSKSARRDLTERHASRVLVARLLPAV